MNTLAAKVTPVKNAYTEDETMNTLRFDLAQARAMEDKETIKRLTAELQKRINEIFSTQ